MADDDFFKAEEKVETPQPPAEEEKVKVGEAEYTQDELNVLVEKGKFAQEIEQKQNIKLDRVWPGHQELSNKVRDYEKQIEDLKQTKTAAKISEGAELTPEETKEQVRKELKQYGAVLEDDVNELFDRRMEAREIRQDTQSVVETFDEKYGIKTDEQTILNHMIETGIRNPEKAAKDLYEDKVDAYKEKQLDSLKRGGMVTDTTSMAGAKRPQTEPVTRENIFAKIDEVLDRQV